MGKGTVTISIDLELAWGNWDNLTEKHVHHLSLSERVIVARLVQIFDRYDLPVTWAFVSALLDQKSAQAMPGEEAIWYAPDIIDTIRSARVGHDMGSHGGRHRYFDAMSDDEAIEDLSFARDIHRRNGLPFQSFVFPRNKVAKRHLLEQAGLSVFRGEDIAWHQTIRGRNPLAGRAANLVDKMLPIAPQAVSAERSGNLTDLPGSMLFLGRDGIRRFASPKVLAAKLRRGMDAAQSSGKTFHLWFHPSNFWHDMERQFDTFETFARDLSERQASGDLLVKRMSDHA